MGVRNRARDRCMERWNSVRSDARAVHSQFEQAQSGSALDVEWSSSPKEEEKRVSAVWEQGERTSRQGAESDEDGSRALARGED